MRSFLLILIFFCFTLQAQDKLFFKNGTSKKGIIVSVVKDFVYFKQTDTSAVEKINKSKLILMEDYKGNRYLISSEENTKDSVALSTKKTSSRRNIFSIQPMSFLFGRATFAYERLSKDEKIGFVIPLILTFDPAFGNFYKNLLLDSTINSTRIKGFNYITGLDVNFYLGKGNITKFFVGPRIRYGTDVAFLNVEGYTIQTQIGFKVSRPEGRAVQHLSLGFGFVRLISSPILRSDPKQSHLWYSLNYRLGIKW